MQDIEKMESGYEYFIRKEFRNFFPWLGEFRLEVKSPPLFKEQESFVSAMQVRVYRLWKNNLPQRCCVKFVYDNRDGKHVYLAEFSKESREVLKAMDAHKIYPQIDTEKPIHTTNI
jgi:hypothetical protein